MGHVYPSDTPEGEVSLDLCSHHRCVCVCVWGGGGGEWACYVHLLCKSYRWGDGACYVHLINQKKWGVNVVSGPRFLCPSDIPEGEVSGWSKFTVSMAKVQDFFNCKFI